MGKFVLRWLFGVLFFSVVWLSGVNRIPHGSHYGVQAVSVLFAGQQRHLLYVNSCMKSCSTTNTITTTTTNHHHHSHNLLLDPYVWSLFSSLSLHFFSCFTNAFPLPDLINILDHHHSSSFGFIFCLTFPLPHLVLFGVTNWSTSVGFDVGFFCPWAKWGQ